MTDTATTRKRLRKQSLGSNTNTWGDTKLNEVLDALDQLIDGVDSIVLTGDVTLTTTNYTTADQAKYRIHRFTGSLSAAATVTYPSVEGWYYVTNSTGQTVTVKCSGGTGVAIPNNRAVFVFGDATDLYSMVPNYLPTASTLTNNNDLITYSQVAALIALATLPGTSGTLRNSAADTTSDYGSAKVTAKTLGGLVRSTLNAAGNEQSQFALDPTNLTTTTNVAATDIFPLQDATAGAVRGQTRANVVGKWGLILQADQTSGFTVSAGNLYPCDTTSAGFTVAFPASASRGDIFAVFKFGTNTLAWNINGLKWYGGTSNPNSISAEGASFFYYTGPTRGWIDL